MVGTAESCDEVEGALCVPTTTPGTSPAVPPDTDGGQMLRSGNLVAAKKR